MFLKTQWLLEQGGGIVFSTGTPIANTIAESWTMARYLMRETLEELGLQHFDAWAKLFADTVVIHGKNSQIEALRIVTHASSGRL